MKKLLIGAILAGFTLPTAAAAAPVDPLAIYTFENGLGTDDSGNGNTGSVLSGATAANNLGFDGGTALRLDPANGNSGINTGLNISGSAYANVTFGGWVQTTTIGNSGAGGKVLSQDNGGFGRTLGVDSRGNSAGYDYAAFTGSGVVDANGSGSLFSSWTHLTVVYNGANSGLYVNGTLSESFVDTTPLLPGSETLFIGSNRKFSEDFHGLVDDIFVYGRALNGADINDIFVNGITNPAPVPLPAGLPLLLLGMGSFGALRMRAKRN